MEEKTLTIRIAEMGVVRSRNGVRSVLKTTLGSCVGVILSDRVKGIHGLAHILLPERLGEDKATGKYADTGVPALVGEMERAGSSRKDMEALVIGGASMFQAVEASNLPSIGEKNVGATLRILGRMGIPVVFQDTGGTCGRTVTFDGTGGKPEVRTLSAGRQP